MLSLHVTCARRTRDVRETHATREPRCNTPYCLLLKFSCPFSNLLSDFRRSHNDFDTPAIWNPPNLLSVGYQGWKRLYTQGQILCIFFLFVCIPRNVNFTMLHHLMQWLSATLADVTSDVFPGFTGLNQYTSFVLLAGIHRGSVPSPMCIYRRLFSTHQVTDNHEG
jgi:hypothetical protein